MTVTHCCADLTTEDRWNIFLQWEFWTMLAVRIRQNDCLFLNRAMWSSANWQIQLVFWCISLFSLFSLLSFVFRPLWLHSISLFLFSFCLCHPLTPSFYITSIELGCPDNSWHGSVCYHVSTAAAAAAVVTHFELLWWQSWCLFWDGICQHMIR